MSIDRSFVRIAAAWSVEEALEVLSAIRGISRAIVHRVDGGHEYFYLYELVALVTRLSANRGRTVMEALDLHEYQATPVVRDAGAAGRSSAVVVDGGRIAGFVDPMNVGFGAPMSLTRFLPDALGRMVGGGRGLAARAPAQLAVGAEASVLVVITADPGAPGASPLAAAAGDTIDLVLDVSGGAEVVGAADATVTIDSPGDLVRQFKIRGRAAGAAQVKVYAFKDRAPVGSTEVSIEVVAAAAAPAPAPPQVESHSAIVPGGAPPDLTVLVFEDKAAQTYKMRLTTADASLGLNLAPFGPIVLAGDVETFFTAFYGDIESILTSTASAREKVDQLAAKGTYLFQKVVPADLQARLWALRAHIKSVQIQTEEPWVPWELCKLSFDDGGGVQEGGFLAEEFEVTRWFLGIPQRPTLTSRAIGVVAPPDAGLAAQSAERAFLLGLAGGARTVVDIAPTAIDLRAALAAATFDVVHFTGHGTFVPGNADRSSIELAGARRLSPEDLCGKVANLGKTHPLIVLNACEIGRAGTALGGLAGWPQGFVKAGAGAFVGPFWRIADGTASQFTQELYPALLGGATIGAAVHRARQAIRGANDPTWLSYVAYAHPDAMVSS